tara:strand:+ start:170 stop:406 length:237 start_codon:yes stop_codon:yes gene_type:complete
MVVATIAFFLCWIWIEISLFIVSKKFSKQNDRLLSYKRFVLILRILGTIMFVFTILYMYNFQNIKFQQALEYCLGIFK